MRADKRAERKLTAVSADAGLSSSAGPRRWLVLAVLCTSLLLAGIDLTVLNVAVPSMTRDLLPTGPQLLWIVDIYSLTVAALLVTCGTLGDRIGRKRLLLAGFVVFGVASAACAFSVEPGQLIAARALLGVGTAMIISSTVSVIRVVFVDARERTLAIGFWTAAHSVGATIGPAIGGVLLHWWWWGSVFLINIPIIALVLLAGALVVPESKNPEPRRWDALSALLSVAGLAGVVYALKEAGARLDLDATIVMTAAMGVVLLGYFAYRQLRLPQPLLDFALFKSRRFVAAVVSVLGCFGCYVALLYLITQWLQFPLGYSPTAAGLAMVPLAAANAVGAAGAPWLANRWGAGRCMTISLAVFAGALAVMAGGSGLDRYSAIVAVLCVAGTSAGVVMTLGADVIMAAARPERAGEAAAIQETSFELGAGLGVAILGTVLNGVYRAVVTPIDELSPAEQESVDESIGAAAEVASELEPATAAAVLRTADQAFQSGFTVALIVGAVVLALTAIFSATQQRRGS